MKPLSAEHWERVYRERSFILRFDPAPKRGRPARTIPLHGGALLDLRRSADVKRALDNLLAEDLDRRGLPYGHIPYCKHMIGEAERAWERYLSRQQHLKGKGIEPIGIWAERVNKLRGRLRAHEAEVEHLKSLLALYEQQEHLKERPIRKRRGR